MDGFSLDTAILVALIGLFGSAIISLVNAMVLEPRKSRIDRKNEWDKFKKERDFEREKLDKEKDDLKEQLRNALYSEMAHIYCQLKSTLDKTTEISLPLLDLIFCFDMYAYMKANPVLFYQFTDAHAIDSIYRDFRRAMLEVKDLFSDKTVSSGTPVPVSAYEWLTKYTRNVNRLILDSGANRDLFKRFIRPEFNKYLTELEKEEQQQKSNN